jgi:chain length determinant protein (polysaccharide antigen chain regulator)
MNKIDATILPQIQARYADDEVDLLELFALIWEGKWFVIGVTVLSALVAFFVIQSMPSIYRVEVMLGGPSQYNIQILQPSALELKNGGHYQVKPLNADALYATSLAHTKSLHIQKAFWEKQFGQPLVLSGPDADTSNLGQAFREFTQNLQVTPPKASDGGGSLTSLSLDTEHPEQGVELLTSYINFVDRLTIRGYVSQLEAAYETNLARLAENYQSLKEREKLKLEDELIRLNEAYQLAKALNIVLTPYDQLANVELSILDERQYLLGATALAEEINALKARQQKPLEAFVPELRGMERWQEQMESDLRRLQAAAARVNALTVVNPPESSLEPVKPNKPLIFLAVVFGAATFAVILVFIHHGVRSYRARNVT